MPSGDFSIGSPPPPNFVKVEAKYRGSQSGITMTAITRLNFLERVKELFRGMVGKRQFVQIKSDDGETFYLKKAILISELGESFIRNMNMNGIVSFKKVSNNDYNAG